jgi:hypothetical protein
MISSTSDARRLLEKYHFQQRPTHHLMYALYHNEKLILMSRVSHGEKQIPPHVIQEIRKQMKLNSRQFQDASSCALTREQYIAILRTKGLITED